MADETSDADGSTTTVPDDDPLPVGVKLGSTRTVLAYPDRAGDLTVTQTLSCLATYADPITGEDRMLYGEEAAEQYPDRVQYMLRSGLPEDEDSVVLAERFFDSVLRDNNVPADSVVVYAIPTIDNPTGLENLETVIEGSQIGDQLVRSFPESLCGALPALGDGLEGLDQIFLSVNMGSTNLEASAYRRGEQLNAFSTGAVTGNEVDRMIANRIEEETQGRVNIDVETAREYKEEHADFESFDPFTDVIQQPGGGSHEFTIETSIMSAVNEYLDDVVDEIANTFLPQLASDNVRVYRLALDEPIVLTGGMACLPGIVEEFADRLSEELDQDVQAIAPEQPDRSAAIGAQRIADRLVETAGGR